jgi:hypothetical protein
MICSANSAIDSGYCNLLYSSACNTFIGSGGYNTMSGCYSSIAGGGGNDVSGLYSSVLGGACNIVPSTHNFAGIFGCNVTAVASCTFHVNCLNACSTPPTGSYPIGTIFYFNGGTPPVNSYPLYIQMP